MRKFIVSITVFLLFTSNCCAEIPTAIIKRYRQIVQLINEDKVIELSKLIEYPLKRENPLPDIASSQQFTSYYFILFDGVFKKKLKHYHDSLIFEHNGTYGLVGDLFGGEIWINEGGKIVTINYTSHRELNLKSQLKKKIQSKMHSSVRSWDENVLVAKSEKLLIRIDRTDKGLRYASWSKGRPISEKPDLVLFNGVEEAQGTMGGWTWTFVNDGWSYVINDVELCESEENCGLFLRLFYNNVQKSSTKLQEIK